ncbi:hypothetical protein GCM10009628_22810 [Paeniglutamicibacter kerguelensis]
MGAKPQGFGNKDNDWSSPGFPFQHFVRAAQLLELCFLVLVFHAIQDPAEGQCCTLLLRKPQIQDEGLAMQSAHDSGSHGSLARARRPLKQSARSVEQCVDGLIDQTVPFKDVPVEIDTALRSEKPIR